MVKARSWKRSKPSLPSPYLNHLTAAVRRRKEEEAKRHVEEEELKRAGTEVHAEDVAPKAELSEDAVRTHIAEVEQKLDTLNDEKHKVILRLKQLLKDEETRKQAERAREEREAAERARQAAAAAAAAAAGQRKTLFSPAPPGSSLPPPMHAGGMIGSPTNAVPRPMPFINREPPQPPHGRGKPLHASSPGLLNSPRQPSAVPPTMYSPQSTAPPLVPAPAAPMHYGGPPPYVQFPGPPPYVPPPPLGVPSPYSPYGGPPPPQQRDFKNYPPPHPHYMQPRTLMPPQRPMPAPRPAMGRGMWNNGSNKGW